MSEQVIVGNPRGGHAPQVVLRQDAQADKAMGLRLGRALVRHYPGHPWIVEATAQQGVAIVRHGLLNEMFPAYRLLAYVVKLGDLSTDAVIDREAVTAGGELLEYFNVARGGFEGLQAANPTFARLPKGRVSAS